MLIMINNDLLCYLSKIKILKAEPIAEQNTKIKIKIPNSSPKDKNYFDDYYQEYYDALKEFDYGDEECDDYEDEVILLIINCFIK